MNAVQMEPDQWQLGRTKVFIKNPESVWHYRLYFYFLSIKQIIFSRFWNQCIGGFVLFTSKVQWLVAWFQYFFSYMFYLLTYTLLYLFNMLLIPTQGIAHFMFFLKSQFQLFSIPGQPFVRLTSIECYFWFINMLFFSYFYLKSSESVNLIVLRVQSRNHTDNINQDKCSWFSKKRLLTFFTIAKSDVGCQSIGTLLVITLVSMITQNWEACLKNENV